MQQQCNLSKQNLSPSSGNICAENSHNLKPHQMLVNNRIPQTAIEIYNYQAFNEALIDLLVLMYQIDGKVTLTEQDYFEEVISKIHWQSGVALSAYVNDAIHRTRQSIDQNKVREFLFGLSKGLNHDPACALELAMDITEVDGNRSEEELELLSLLSNRVLTQGLVA